MSATKHNHKYPNLHTNKHSSTHKYTRTRACIVTQYIWSLDIVRTENLPKYIDFFLSLFFLHVTSENQIARLFAISTFSFTVRLVSFGFVNAVAEFYSLHRSPFFVQFMIIIIVIIIFIFTALSHYLWVILSVAFILFHSLAWLRDR